MNHPDEMTFRVGDLHLGHRLVAATRGFFDPQGQPDVEAHDEAVLQSIRETVPRGATLVLYGDNSNNRDWEHALRLLTELKVELNLTLELVIGNHDLIHPMHRFDAAILRAFSIVFDRIDERRVEKKWDRRILSSHFPGLRGDDDRHSARRDDLWRWPESAVANPRTWVIHAHTHQPVLFEAARPRHLCVSWDVRRRPIADTEIRQAVLEQMGKRRLHGVASWGEREPFRDLAGRWARHEVTGRALPATDGP